MRGYLVCDRMRMRSPAELEGCLHGSRGGAYALFAPPLATGLVPESDGPF